LERRLEKTGPMCFYQPECKDGGRCRTTEILDCSLLGTTEKACTVYKDDLITIDQCKEHTITKCKNEIDYKCDEGCVDVRWCKVCNGIDPKYSDMQIDEETRDHILTAYEQQGLDFWYPSTLI